MVPRRTAVGVCAERERVPAAQWVQPPHRTWELLIARPRERHTPAVQALCAHHDARVIAGPVAPRVHPITATRHGCGVSLTTGRILVR